MKLYLAGPMTGIPQFNFPAFYAAEKELREMGYEVVNPAELDPPEVQKAAWDSPDGQLTDGGVAGHTWAEFLARDVKAVAGCDGLVLLPGWQTSKGARLERFVAQLLGLPVYELVGRHLRLCPAYFQLVSHDA